MNPNYLFLALIPFQATGMFAGWLGYEWPVAVTVGVITSLIVRGGRASHLGPQPLADTHHQ